MCYIFVMTRQGPQAKDSKYRSPSDFPPLAGRGLTVGQSVAKETNMKTKTRAPGSWYPIENRMMWSMWRDFFISSKTWRMKTPIGILAFKTKRDAVMAKTLYENSMGRAERVTR